jgi:hypothetical protein
MTGVASKAIAGCLALAAFAVAVLAGLAGGNTANSILLRALVAMVACYPVGLLIGLVCQHVIEQHVARMADPEAGAGAEQKDQSAEEARDVPVA